MSALALFDHSGNGETYSPIPDAIWALPTGEQPSAMAVWSAVCRYLRPGLTELPITDQELSQAPCLEHRSLQFLRKGLLALETAGLIERRRRHGLRTIIVLGRLRGRARPPLKVAKPVEPPIQSVPFTPPRRLTAEELADVRKLTAQMRESGYA